MLFFFGFGVGSMKCARSLDIVIGDFGWICWTVYTGHVFSICSVSRIFTRGAAGEFSKSARSRLCDFRSGFMASIEIYLPSFESTCDREI